MRMYDIIAKKRNGEILTKEEIYFFVNDYVQGKIPDYQMSALLMAIYLNGMNDEEISELTMSMANSGDMIDLSSIKGLKVDKHSTGGVGDKTTVVIAPVVAACGVPVAKMSGKGLGHTGGTIDKLESIPGFKTQIAQTEFIDLVNKIGVSVVGQSGNLAPADKKIYALRDVTATVDSIPLIAASIMSKKIAAGSDCILLDVKAGSGAFMKTMEHAQKLAQKMVSIGEMVGRKTIALITNMDVPLGNAIGNSLEVIEAIETLRGNGPQDLIDICVILSSNMLYLAGKGTLDECESEVIKAIRSGAAFNKFVDMVEAQGGDVSYIKDTSKFKLSDFTHDVVSAHSGYINTIDTEKCGVASMILGAGREKIDSKIDYGAGIMLNVKCGNYVNKGDVIARLYTSDKNKILDAEKLLLKSIVINDIKAEEKPLIYSRVSKL